MLIADVFDVVLIDNKSGDVIATTTLTQANIAVSVQENDVRGGKGNQLIGVLHAQRDITLNLTDAEFRYEWLAKQLGQDIVTGAGVAYAMPKFYTAVDNTGTGGGIEITLDNKPSDTASVAIFDDLGVKVASSDYTVDTATGKVTFTTSVVAGDKVEVRTYKYATDATTETINIDNAVFSSGVMAVLETVEIDGNEIVQSKLQYQFTNAVPTGNFNINTASARTAATQQFDLKVIKPDDSNLVGQILRIPVA